MSRLRIGAAAGQVGALSADELDHLVDRVKIVPTNHHAPDGGASARGASIGTMREEEVIARAASPRTHRRTMLLATSGTVWRALTSPSPVAQSGRQRPRRFRLAAVWAVERCDPRAASGAELECGRNVEAGAEPCGEAASERVAASV